MNLVKENIIQFNLPGHLACPLPSEDRGLQRDEVRLLVTECDGREINHAKFRAIHEWLLPGDVLVVNTSATRPSAIPVSLPSGGHGMLHLSNKLNTNEWLIEIREIIGNKTIRWKGGEDGLVFQLPDKALVTLKKRFYKDHKMLDLWHAEVTMKQGLEAYLTDHALPIKYDKLDKRYPLSYYQTFFSFLSGSAEMPSAGRGFTPALVEKLQKQGVIFAPVLLHTGVSSLEEDETPYPEYMEINPVSASIINAAKSQGRRIIAIGTTAIRAIESASTEGGIVLPYQGNTSLFIEQHYTMKIADGLLTGFHEPKASHLHMLQSLAGFEHIEKAYSAAIEGQYYWHEFGDLHLILA